MSDACLGKYFSDVTIGTTTFLLLLHFLQCHCHGPQHQVLHHSWEKGALHFSFLSIQEGHDFFSGEAGPWNWFSHPRGLLSKPILGVISFIYWCSHWHWCCVCAVSHLEASDVSVLGTNFRVRLQSTGATSGQNNLVGESSVTATYSVKEAFPCKTHSGRKRTFNARLQLWHPNPSSGIMRKLFHDRNSCHP